MRLVLASDLHLDWKTHGVKRLPEIAFSFSRVVDAAIERNADLACLGDVFDPDSGPEILMCTDFLIRQALRMREAGLRSFWVAGNHDVCENGLKVTSLTPLTTVGEGCFVFERPAWVEIKEGTEKLRVVGLPYVATHADYDPAEFVRGFGNVSRTIILGHMTWIEDIEEGEETREMPRGRMMRFPLEECRKIPDVHMFNGHFHRAQNKHGIDIPGALAQLTHGEEFHAPSFLYFDSEA